jgi:membrane protein implicated in regulation of membrane protease activity
MTPWGWALIGLVLLLSELLSTSFYMIYLALAAAITAILSLAVTGLVAQLAVFAVASSLALAVLRPRTVSWLLRSRGAPTVPYPDLANRRGVVRETVTDQGGLVDLGGGEFWSARPFPPGDRLEPGTPVQVAYRQGVVLYVQRVSPKE